MERRKFSRHTCSIPVLLKTKTESVQLLTKNVSRHGAFLITDDLKPERQLLQLIFALPEKKSVEVMVMVARRTRDGLPEEKRTGMGVDFFAMSKEDKNRWDAFVFELQNPPAPPENPIPTSVAEAPIRRRHQRFVNCFLVRMRDKDRLRKFYTKDISTGGMFLKTPMLPDLHSTVELILIHPETDHEFRLMGIVVRLLDGPTPQERGIGIQFHQLSPVLHAALVEFIESGVNYLENPDEKRAERLRLFRKALDLTPTSAQAFISLGEEFLEEIEPQAAVEAFQKAIALEKNSTQALRGLYKAYTMLGRPDSANSFLKRLRQLECQD